MYQKVFLTRKDVFFFLPLFATLLGLISLFVVVLATPIHSSTLPWSEILSLFQKGKSQAVIQHLQTMLQESNEVELQKKAVMLLGKSYLTLAQFKKALTVFRFGQEIDPTEKYLWNYYQFLTHAQAKQFVSTSTLLTLFFKSSTPTYYSQKIKELIIKHYDTEEALRVLYPFLHQALENSHPYMKDFRILQLYRKGAISHQMPLPESFYINQWLYPHNKKALDLAEKEMWEVQRTRQLILQPKEFLIHFQTIDQLRLDKELIEKIPKKITFLKNQKLKSDLGKIYIRALFRQKKYQTILDPQKTQVFTKQFQIPIDLQEYWKIRSYQKKKQPLQAQQLIQSLEKRSPQSQFLPQLYTNMGKYYLIRKQKDMADDWWKRLIRRFPKHENALMAYWELIWYRIQQNRKTDALVYFDPALQHPKLSPENTAKFLYWKGKLAYQLKKIQTASQSFMQLQQEFPNTFYALVWEIKQKQNQFPKLGTLSTPGNSLKFWHDSPPSPNPTIRKNLAYYAFLFEVDEAELAKFQIRKDVHSSKEYSQLWGASSLLYQYQEYHALQKIVANYFLWDTKKLPIKDQPLWRFAYPLAYWSGVKKYSQQFGVNPFLVLAVMREESHFYPQAVSRTNAKGLMQLMPQTAKQQAKWRRISLQQRSLFEPELNYHLGIYYLSRLQRQFVGEHIHMVGAYNGGPGNMKKWIKRWKQLEFEEFIESVPFPETQNYIKRVFTSFQMYTKIYGSPALH